MLLNATAMFNHANASLPSRIEGLVRSVLVTPDMHRIHHQSTTTNRLAISGSTYRGGIGCFGTYRRTSKLSQETMTLGVDAFRDPKDLRWADC